MTARMKRPYQNEESGNSKCTMSLVSKIHFKEIPKKLLQCFCKGLEQHSVSLFQHNFADLGHVFAHWFN